MTARPLMFDTLNKPVLTPEALETAGATADHILGLSEKFEVDSLRLQFTDVTGINKNVEVPKSQFGRPPAT